MDYKPEQILQGSTKISLHVFMKELEECVDQRLPSHQVGDSVQVSSSQSKVFMLIFTIVFLSAQNKTQVNITNHIQGSPDLVASVQNSFAAEINILRAILMDRFISIIAESLVTDKMALMMLNAEIRKSISLFQKPTHDAQT